MFTGGEGPRTVLLLHGGWMGAALHWSGVWDRLAQRARVVAPDLPGQQPEAFVEAVEAFAAAA